MPPKPISRLNAVAKRPTIAISVSSCRKKCGSASGATTSTTTMIATTRSEPIVTRGLARRSSSLFRRPEQSPRAHDEHDGHEGEEQHDRDRRKDQDAERLEQPDEQCAHEAAGKASESPDDDDHERRRQHVAVHADR